MRTSRLTREVHEGYQKELGTPLSYSEGPNYCRCNLSWMEWNCVSTVLPRDAR